MKGYDILFLVNVSCRKEGFLPHFVVLKRVTVPCFEGMGRGNIPGYMTGETLGSVSNQ